MPQPGLVDAKSLFELHDQPPILPVEILLEMLLQQIYGSPCYTRDQLVLQEWHLMYLMHILYKRLG